MTAIRPDRDKLVRRTKHTFYAAKRAGKRMTWKDARTRAYAQLTHSYNDLYTANGYPK